RTEPRAHYRRRRRSGGVGRAWRGSPPITKAPHGVCVARPAHRGGPRGARVRRPDRDAFLLLRADHRADPVRGLDAVSAHGCLRADPPRRAGDAEAEKHVHYGVVGAQQPGGVFRAPEDCAPAWRWGGIRAASVAGGGVPALIAWRL